jgi:hypothetical protein
VNEVGPGEIYIADEWSAAGWIPLGYTDEGHALTLDEGPDDAVITNWSSYAGKTATFTARIQKRQGFDNARVYLLLFRRTHPRLRRIHSEYHRRTANRGGRS